MRPIALRLARSLPHNFGLEDLIAAGTVGLVEAAGRYRPAEHGGCPFGAYARKWIRGAMLDSVRRGAWDEAMRPALDTAPEPAAEPSVERDIDAAWLHRRIERAIRQLPARQRKLMDMHYRQELQLRIVGRRLGVGKSRASQLHLAAVRTLREAVFASFSQLPIQASVRFFFAQSPGSPDNFAPNRPFLP